MCVCVCLCVVVCVQVLIEFHIITAQFDPFIQLVALLCYSHGLVYASQGGSIMSSMIVIVLRKYGGGGGGARGAGLLNTIGNFNWIPTGVWMPILLVQSAEHHGRKISACITISTVVSIYH